MWQLAGISFLRSAAGGVLPRVPYNSLRTSLCLRGSAQIGSVITRQEKPGWRAIISILILMRSRSTRGRLVGRFRKFQNLGEDTVIGGKGCVPSRLGGEGKEGSTGHLRPARKE
jgi:hypothetical protein